MRLALVIAILAGAGLLTGPSLLGGGAGHATAQTIPPLNLRSVTATCGPSGPSGVVTVENTGASAASGRVRLFFGAQFQQGGPWTRGADALVSLDLAAPAAGTASVPYGPIPLRGYPEGAIAVRVEAVLDVVTTGPTGATIVVWDVQTMASSAACPVATPAAIPGGAVYASGFAGVCTSSEMVGEATISNTTHITQTIKTTFTLAYQDGPIWVQHPGTDQVFSTTVEAGGLVTIPFHFPMKGIPADVTLVRAEIELTGIEFVGGQSRRTADILTTGATSCPAGTPGSVTKDGAYIAVLGDSLTAISERTGSPLDEMLAANGLEASSRIYVGQSLLVPRPAVKPAATKTTVVTTGRGTVAAGTPIASASTKTPAATNTPTPKTTPTARATATATETETATKTATKAPVVAGPVSATPGSQPVSGPDGPDGKSSSSLLDRLLPIVIGALGIVAIAVSGFFAFVVFRRWRAGAGWGQSGSAKAAAAAASAVPPPAAAAQPRQPLAPPAKKSGSLDNPAAIPLNGELGDLLGLERNRSQVARLFVPDPSKVEAGESILGEARGLAGQLRRAS